MRFSAHRQTIALWSVFVGVALVLAGCSGSSSLPRYGVYRIRGRQGVHSCPLLTGRVKQPH